MFAFVFMLLLLRFLLQLHVLPELVDSKLCMKEITPKDNRPCVRKMPFPFGIGEDSDGSNNSICVRAKHVTVAPTAS